MHQLPPDSFPASSGPFNSLDPRVKIVTTLAIILGVVSLPSGGWVSLGVIFFLLTGLILAARLPLIPILRRCLFVVALVGLMGVFIPFVRCDPAAGVNPLSFAGVCFSCRGLTLYGSMLANSLIALLAILLLTGTTSFPAILRALDDLGVPPILIAVLSLAYRYLFILGDDLRRMKHALDSRGWVGARLRDSRALGWMIGGLFLRTFERGERIHLSMLSRGFEGTPAHAPAAPLRARDILLIAAAFALAIGIRWIHA